MTLSPAFATPLPLLVFSSAVRASLPLCVTRSTQPARRRRRVVITATARPSAPVPSPPPTTTAAAPSYTTVDPFSDPFPTAATDTAVASTAAGDSSSSTSVDPVVIVPGYGATAEAYEGLRRTMADALKPALVDVSVVPVTRWTWAATVGGRPVTPVITLVDSAVRDALARTGASRVTLVAHSAGGWISRIFLGDVAYPPPQASGAAAATATGNGRDGDDEGDDRARVWGGRRRVKRLVCLGTPQMSGEPVTRRNMAFVNREYPGAFYNDLEYVNLGGDAVTVHAVPWWRFWDAQWMPALSYKLTDPEAGGDAAVPVEAAGDGIVPLSVAFLQGASANVRLSGVWHSPDSAGPWYGDERVVRYWIRFLK